VPAKFYALAFLLVAACDNSMSREEAIAVLWGPPASPQASASFRQFLARMRKIEKRIGAGLFLHDRGTVRLSTTAIKIDLKEVSETDIAGAISRGDLGVLRAFVERTDAKLLEGMDFGSDFADRQRDIENRLANETVRAIQALFDRDDGRDPGFEREGLAQQLIRLDPSQELGYRILMELYCESDRRHLAHETYQTCKAALLADYGLQPELATRQLAASLGLEHSPMVLASTPPEQAAADGIARAGPEQDALPRIGSPRLMLLPPRVVVDDETVTRIGAALVDDISGGLTRYRSVTVLAPHSGRAAASDDTAAIGRKYGLDYLVKTSIRPAQDGLTASFLLINSRTGVMVTAIETAFRTTNLPDIFNRVSAEVIHALVGAIEKAEIELPTATGNKHAYRQFLEGKQALWRVDLPDLRRARSHFQKAMESSDRFAPALAGLARTLSMERLVRGIVADDMLITALELAERAIRLDPQDGRGLRERGFASLYLRRHDESLRSFEAAAFVSPNDADMLADFADALSHSGQPKEALAACLRAKALNPAHPEHYDWIHASILYLLARYEEAVLTLEPMRDNPGTARLLAAANAMAGHQDAAKYFARIVVETYPDFRLSDLVRLVPDKNVQDTRHLLEGLYRAGLR